LDAALSPTRRTGIASAIAESEAECEAEPESEWLEEARAEVETDLFYYLEVYPDSSSGSVVESSAESKPLSEEHPILCDLAS
jgi:hypothetical protein